MHLSSVSVIYSNILLELVDFNILMMSWYWKTGAIKIIWYNGWQVNILHGKKSRSRNAENNKYQKVSSVKLFIRIKFLLKYFYNDEYLIDCRAATGFL